MKELQKGTPVWVGDTPREYVFTSSYGQHYTNRLLETDSVITPLDSHIGATLTVQQYIKHVMVPDGWLCDNDNTCHKYYNGSYEEKRVIINFSGNEVYLYIEDDMPFIDDVLFYIIKQGRAHLKKLNLLKELENKQT